MRRLVQVIALAGLVAGPIAAQDFTTLKGHGGPIMGLATSPTGVLASASFDNAVGVWNGPQPTWYDGHDAAVVTVAFVDETRLVSGGDDFTVLLWHEGRAKTLGRHLGKVTDLAVSPDGRVVASASWDGTIGLWSLDGDHVRSLSGHSSGVAGVTFSSDGMLLFAATSKGEIVVYDLQSGEEQPRVLIRHGFAVNKIVLGPGDRWLAYGAVDGVTRVIDPDTGDGLHDFTLERRPILAMRHNDQTSQLAVGDGHGFIMVIDTENWRITRDFRATREGPVWALAFSPDGQTVWAGGLDDVIYGWPVELLDEFQPQMGQEQHSFLRAAETMSNGERQFMRKCSICHATEKGASRKAGPSLYGLFGRPAGTVPGYRYSDTLDDSDIVWTAETVDRLFDLGPDNYIPGSKMPMQVIAGEQDRRDLIAWLRDATQAGE